MRIAQSPFICGFLAMMLVMSSSPYVFANTHENATCRHFVDCDDPISLIITVNGALRCTRMLCVGGANNFTWCDAFPSAISPCITSGSANINCGTECSYHDCGAPVNGTCNHLTCDTSGPPTPYNGTLTIIMTCT